MKEVWKHIEEFEGLYQVSTSGNIKSLDRLVESGNSTFKLLKSRILKPQYYTNGYQFVSLSKNGKVYQKSIHRLVAKAFIENYDISKEVNHKDEIKSNNRTENLEWMSHKENINHGTAIQRRVKNSNFKKENNPMYGRRGSENKNSKPINQYDLNNNFIKRFDSSATIERQYGYNASSIIGVARGRCKQAYGFIWKYAENINS